MNTNHQQDNGKKNASLTRKRKYFSVPASPLNAVKLDLAIIIVIAVIVVVMVSYLVKSHTLQIIYLAIYGVLAMAWLILKTRRVVRQCQDASFRQDPP